MKLNATRVQGIIVFCWFLSFIFCVIVAVFYWKDIPSGREIFVKQAFESFAPGLGVMLAALFSKKSASQTVLSGAGHDGSALVTSVAVAIAIVYVSFFIVPVILFLRGKAQIETVNEMFPVLRLYSNWFALPVLAYYFGSTPHRRTSATVKKNKLSEPKESPGKTSD